MPVWARVVLAAVLVDCVAGPMYVAIKAEGAVWRITRESWARLSHRQRIIQGVLIPAWFGIIAVVFVADLAVTRRLSTAAETAGFVALGMTVLGPFVGFAIGKRLSGRRDHANVTQGPAST
jgi:hypothetical protein